MSFSTGFVLGAKTLVPDPCVSVHYMWELRSLWWWRFRLWATAVWHQLISWINTDVLEEPSASCWYRTN